MSIGTILFAGQYIIIGFFILVHFIIGLKRNMFKSLYYLAVFILTIGILFVGLHYFTITAFISREQIVQLILQSGKVPPEYQMIFDEPEALDVIIAAITSLLKVVLWIVGYSIIKPSITWLFSLIYNFAKKVRKSKVYILIYLFSIGSAVATVMLLPNYLTPQLIRQILEDNRIAISLNGTDYLAEAVVVIGILMQIIGALIVYIVTRIIFYVLFFSFRKMFVTKEKRLAKKEKIKQLKKRPKTKLRIPVALLRGALSGLVFVYPVLMMISIMASVIPVFNGVDSMVNNNEATSFSNDELNKYFKEIEEFNKQSIFTQFNLIKINNKGLADYSVDYFTETKIEGSDVYFSMFEEIRDISQILVAIEEVTGTNYDLLSLTHDNLETIKPLFDYISQSKLIGQTADSGVRVFLKTMINQSNLDQHRKDELIQTADDLSISSDFASLYTLADSLLKLGDVSQVIHYLSNPTELLNLEENQDSVVDLIKWFANLSILEHSGTVVKIMLYSEFFSNQITWCETAEEKIEYIDRVFGFLDNDNYIPNQLINLSVILQVMYQVDPQNITRAEFFANFNPLYLLTETNPEWVSDFATAIINQFDLIFDSSQFFVDLLIGNENAYFKELGYLLAEESNLGQYIKDELLGLVPIYERLVDLGLDEHILSEQLKPLVLLDQLGKNGFLVSFLEDNIYTSTFISNFINRVAANLIVSLVGEDEQLKAAIENANLIILADENNSPFDELKVFIELLEILYQNESFTLDGFDPAMLQSALITIEASELSNLIAKSTYMYVMLEHTIRSIDMITISDTVLVDNGMYSGLIRREEIIKLITAIKALEITDFNGLEPSQLKVSKILAAISENSEILNGIIWSNLSLILDEQMGITVYDSEKTTIELIYILQTIQDVGLADSIADIGEDAISSIDLVQLAQIRVQRLNDGVESRLFERVLSTTIVDQLNGEYKLQFRYEDIDSDQVTRLLSGFEILGIKSIDDMTITADDLHLKQINTLLHQDSIVVDRIVAQQVYLTLQGNEQLVISEESYTTVNQHGDILDYPELEKAELMALLEAIMIFDPSGENDLATLQFDIKSLGPDDLTAMIDSESLIIYLSVSKTIKSSFGDNEQVVIPLRAFVDGNPDNDIAKTEIYSLINSLKAGGINYLSDIEQFNYYNATLENLKSMIISGSSIIKATISKQIIGLEDTGSLVIEEYVYDGNGEISNDEIENMFNSLQASGIENLDRIAEQITELSFDQIKNILYDTNREEAYRGESDIIIDTVQRQIQSSNAFTIPNFALDPQKDHRISPSETVLLIDSLVSILNIQSVEELNSYGEFDSMSYRQVKRVLEEPNSSILILTITQYIESGYDAAGNEVPALAYQSDERYQLLKTHEILSLLKAFYLVSVSDDDNAGIEPSDDYRIEFKMVYIETGTVASIKVSIIDKMLDLGSIMINRLLSDTIIGIPGIVHETLSEGIYKEELPETEIRHISKVLGLFNFESLFFLKEVTFGNIKGLTEEDFKVAIDYEKDGQVNNETQGCFVVYYLIRDKVNEFINSEMIQSINLPLPDLEKIKQNVRTRVELLEWFRLYNQVSEFIPS